MNPTTRDDEAGPENAGRYGQDAGRPGSREGGGFGRRRMVKVEVTGAIELKSIKIDPTAVDPNDVEMLEDMIMAATNEALRSAQELANRRLGGITSGLNIPGLPF